MCLQLPPLAQRMTRRWRSLIEAVGAQLSGRYTIEHIRVRDLWHLPHRMICKVLAHTLAIVFNLHLGHSPIDFDGLLAS
jgi:hypothetical protein